MTLHFLHTKRSKTFFETTAWVYSPLGYNEWPAELVTGLRYIDCVFYTPAAAPDYSSVLVQHRQIVQLKARFVDSEADLWSMWLSTEAYKYIQRK